MATEMVACPHCGTRNSAKKQVCFHCRQQISAAPDLGVARRPLRPRAIPVPQEAAPQLEASQRELTAGEVVAKPQPVPAPRPIPRRSSPFFGATLAQRAQWYRQLQALTRSGIPLGLSLSYLGENIGVGIRAPSRDMAQHVQGGGLLSEAMARYPNLFPEWELSMIRAGEKAGTLPEVAREVAETLETEMSLRYQVNSQTWHLKATAVVFVLVIMIVLVAQSSAGAAELFANLGTMLVRFLGIVAGALLLRQGWRTLARTRKGSELIYHFVTRLPLLGPIMRNTMKLRFTRVLRALWSAGVAPMEALETAARSSANQHVINRISDQVAQLGQGATLAEVLASTGLLSREEMYLVQSGETSGSITESLQSVTEYIDMELQSQVKTLPAKAQLIFYGILAPLVGAFVIWYYVSYFTRALGGW